MIYNKELILNSLLVKHQNGSRDLGKIVPSSHNRNELRHMIIRPFRGGNQEDQGVISVLDSPRREAIL